MSEKDEFRTICEEIVKILTETSGYMTEIYHYEIPKFQGNFQNYKPQLEKHLEAIDVEIAYLKKRVNRLVFLEVFIEDETGVYENSLSSIEKYILEIEEKRNNFAQKCEDYFIRTTFGVEYKIDGTTRIFDPKTGKTLDRENLWKNQAQAPKKKPVKPLVKKLAYQKQNPLPTPPQKRTIIENIIRHARIIFEQLFRRTFTF